MKGSTLLELNSLMVVICIQIIFSSVLYENMKLSELVSIGVAKLPERQEPKLSMDKASKWSWTLQVVLTVYDIFEPRHHTCRQNHQFIVG